MDLRQLRTFREVARHGGYTSAARRLKLTQPAVTAQIRTLEGSLGVSLFRIVGKRVLLTDEGQVLLAHADRLLDEAESAVEAVRAVRGLQLGRVSIGASTTPGIYMLPESLARFRRAHPGIAVTLQVANTRDIEQRVADADLDVGVVGQDVNHRGLSVERFSDDCLVAIAPPKHPLARKRRIEPKALSGEGFLAREEGSATWDVTLGWFRRRGVELRTEMDLSSPEALKHAVAAGLGLAIISEHAVAWELADGRLAKLDVRGLPIRRPLWLVTRRASILTAPERALLEHLRRERTRGCG